MDKEFKWMIEQFVNGNVKYAVNHVKKFKRSRLIEFYHFLSSNADWLEAQKVFDCIEMIGEVSKKYKK